MSIAVPSMDRPPVSFVTWSYVPGRSHEIAAALGGEPAVFYDRRLAGRRRVLVRYLVGAVRTVVYLVRRRPRSVIVTLPPVVPGLIVYAYSRLARVRFALDSHPSAFGRKNDRWSRRLLPVHRWLARRAAVTLVTTKEWVDAVHEWGGCGLVLHEAPPIVSVDAPPAARSPLQVLFVCVFSPDEPIDSVLEAARGLDGIEITVTGDLRRARPGLAAVTPPNVRFCGFLDQERYREAIAACDAVLALTTEPTSVMRAAYEATYLQRPLIASGNPAMRQLFDAAVFVDHDARSIRRGLEEMIRRHTELVDRAPQARRRQLDRWERQLGDLRNALALTGKALP